jgi:hypothetical protein
MGRNILVGPEFGFVAADPWQETAVILRANEREARPCQSGNNNYQLTRRNNESESYSPKAAKEESVKPAS